MANEFDKEMELADREDALGAKLAKLAGLSTEQEVSPSAPQEGGEVSPSAPPRRRARSRYLPTEEDKRRLPFHKKGSDPNCRICVLQPEEIEFVKDTYIRAERSGRILARIHEGFPQITRRDLTLHSRAEAWDWGRAARTERGLTSLMRRGEQFVKNNPKAVDGKLLLATIQHIDKREGKIVDKVQTDTVTRIEFISMAPAPGPARGLATAAKGEISGTKPLTLAPTSFEVIEDDGVAAPLADTGDRPSADLPTNTPGGSSLADT